MNRRLLNVSRFFLLPLTLSSVNLLAQKPDVKTIDKINAAVAEIVTIKGDNFGGDASKLTVFFGAVKGSIQSASNQVVEVSVPPGTTYNNISLTNITNGLSGYASEQFLLSYGGVHPFQASNLSAQSDFNAQSGLYDLCMCDFDGDGKSDVATANTTTSSIKILPNNSSGPGNIGFNITNPSTPILAQSLHATCGDLNGDGKPDLAVSESDGGRIFVLRNTSTGIGNFGFSSQIIVLTGRKTKRIGIADLDLDGKPELVVTDQASNNITILVNQSTTSVIQFGSTPISFPVVVPAPNATATTDGLAIQDIDGDKLPEILTTPFQTSSSKVYVIKNNSVPGSINLGAITPINLGTAAVNLRVGDLDGDNKPDIAVTGLVAHTVAIFLNTSTSSSINFSPPATFGTMQRPFGLDFGDLDGDGKTDIAVASISSTEKGITILNNESSPGNLAFQTLKIATTFINRHVNIDDVDGDGKPDLVFTSVDDNNTGILASKISVLRNKSCMVPEITPPGPVAVCSGTPFKLYATVSRGTTYQWKNETTNTVVKNGVDPFLDITTTGKYAVTAIAEGGTCSQVSNSVDVTVSAGTVSGVASALNNGPLCVGNTLNLSVTGVTGATQFKWTGPGGFTATGNPVSIATFGTGNVGRYYVDIISGSCVAQSVSTLVEAIDIGSFTVTYPGSRFMCQGDSKTLTLSPALAGASYQWYETTTGIISGQTSTTLTVTASGNYYARVSYPGCSNTQTDPVNIVVASIPVAAFNMPTQACTGQLVQFDNQSTSDPNATSEYLWTFGDGQTATLDNPEHTYLTANTFNVKLRVTYEGGVCPNETPTKPIAVQAAPIPTITSSTGEYDFCPGESLQLEVAGTYTSYEWSTGETTPSITVTEEGTYAVEVTTTVCTLNASRIVETLPQPSLIVTADPVNIDEGQSSQLNVEGIITFAWLPIESLSDPTIRNPIASPAITTTYTVSGEDQNGCTGEGTIEVSVKGEAIVNKLDPKNFFSPNNDSYGNQNWTIENITDYPQCGVVIYDDKGVKVFESKPYLNDWNGSTGGGKQLPDGVYYFIIKCDGEENTPKTGSISILR